MSHDHTRKELLRFIEEARSERDGLQRDLYRLQDERDVAIAEAAQLRAQLERLQS